MSNSGYHHLFSEERKAIEADLNIPNITLKSIAIELNRSPKCIRYEITTHRYVRIRSNQHNKCGRQAICTVQRLCTHCVSGYCKGCTNDNCNELCEDFIETPVCKRTERFPFVCSGCPNIDQCRLPKYFYSAAKADSQALSDNTYWRVGPKKSAAEMEQVTSSISKGVKNGHSIEVIIAEDNLPISTSTAYRYIEKRYIGDIANIDLKRKVRYLVRKPKIKQISMDYDYLDQRRFEDFTSILLDLDSSVNIWEMDTVEGKKGENEKCVLSLLHRKSNLQLFFLMPCKNMLEVNKIFDAIKLVLGAELFKATFSVILTDNGSEFKDPLSIETMPGTGEKVISIYYCHPKRSEEKGKCEKNHEHFRECVPKGLSMNPLSKHDINHVSSMVNNYPRKQFGFKTPYQIASVFLNEKVFILNRLKSVPSKDVKLTPILHR